MRLTSSLLLGSLILSAAACGAVSTPPPAPPPAAIEPAAPAVSHADIASPTPLPACARRRPGTGAIPSSALHQSSAVALARAGASTIAYVADEDEDAIHTVDVATLAELAVTPLPGSPAELLVLADGRVAVTLRDRNRVAVYEPRERADLPLEERCSAAVAAEPIALATAPDEARLFVTSGLGHALTAFSTTDLARAFTVDVPREPRAVIVDDAGKRAFVTHVTGARLSTIELDDGAVVRPVRLDAGVESRGGTQGYALAKVAVASGAKASPNSGEARAPGRIFAPFVTVDPGQPKQTKGYGDSAGWGPPVAAPIVAVVDAVAARALGQRSLFGVERRRDECLLPRAAAARGSEAVLITCLGLDAVIELDARAFDPLRVERRRFRVPAGPTGVAVDEAGNRAVVFSQFAHEISVLDLSPGGHAARALHAKLARREGSRVSAAFARGRELFHATGDLRVSADGRACASCHPDGRVDTLTWSTPDGPRQTPMLAGRISGSAPYGWFGKNRDLAEHLGHTMRRLGGAGLSAAKDRPDLDALMTYLVAMRAPSRAGAPEDPSRIALASRGRALFHDERQGCASCHADGGTDLTAHDVKSGDVDERSLAFDTPSLRFLADTAPYFHDGRYQTLEELLLKSDGRMGHTRHLAKDDLRAVTAYLETL